jgi:dihydrofolate reductase
VICSINFVQTLLSERLFDRLNLFLYPIVLGSGKKVFGRETVRSNLTLAEPALTSGRRSASLRACERHSANG